MQEVVETHLPQERSLLAPVQHVQFLDALGLGIDNHARGPLAVGQSQTARVVGPAGKEIGTDEYGRIKLQFCWDQQGKNDVDSSCWVRVSQSWSGKSWGAFSLPRVGQEVVVSFLDGNPDRPLVTGCIYNGDNPVPYARPANQSRMPMLAPRTQTSRANAKSA